MPVETLIKLIRGEDAAIVATNSSGMVRHLESLGFEVGEEDGSTKYFEIPAEFVTVRRPKQVREKTDEEKAAIRARLVAGKAAKAEAAAGGKKGSKTAAASAKASTTTTKPATNGKSTASAAKKAAKPAEPEPEEAEEAEEEAPKAKGGLASRVKITR